MNDLTEASDTELLRGIGDRESESLSILYDRHAAALYSVALAVLRSPEDAEETMQEVFMTVWKQPQKHDARLGKVSSWLIRVTRNRAIDRLRARRRRDDLSREVADAGGLFEAALPAGDELAHALDRDRRLRSALEQLSPEQREAVTMAFFRELSHPEIASRAATPLGTIKARIRRGLGRLRDLLGSPT